MPLKLYPPREGRSPYYTVRGTYLGVYLNRSTKTSQRAVATKLMSAWKAELERGAYAKPSDPTFASAAVDYMKAGRERRFLAPLLHHFGEKPLTQIDQRAIDEAAAALYPAGTPATRNRQVYSPTIAVLRHAGLKQEFSRPKGSGGKQRTTFLSVEQAGRLFSGAHEVDAEFASFLIFLCYTGCRLSEALNLQASDVHLSEGWAHVRDGKTGDRTVYLPPVVVAALSSCVLEGVGRVFRFRKNGHLYGLLAKAEERSGVHIPERVAFHIFRHTFGAWMQKAGADLVGTGAWKSQKAANVYKHLEITEEAKKAALLPVIRRKS